MLQEMLEKMEPIQNLWRTAYKFDKCHELWWVSVKISFLNFIEKIIDEVVQ